ncbi:MAG: toll/interleukin-1 receptor domain-containing protein, partial [Actinomycetota bacterium]|nr:toll/interleukin-1 receptor domain-containing protein [Actinomycetota bacterium]
MNAIGSDQDGYAFISYARADGSTDARHLELELRRAGIWTWRDTRDIDAAGDYTSELETAIDAAKLVIVCVTRDSTRKDSFVRREIAYALQGGKPVAVARLADVPPPISVATHTFFELYRNWDQELSSLIRFCRRELTSGAMTENRTLRFQYLQRIYGDVVRYLDRAVLRPLGVRDSRFLEVRGSLAASDAGPMTRSDVLSPRFYRSLDPQVSILKCPREAFDESNRRLAII